MKKQSVDYISEIKFTSVLALLDLSSYKAP